MGPSHGPSSRENVCIYTYGTVGLFTVFAKRKSVRVGNAVVV